MRNLFTPINFAALGVIFIACLAGWRGDYEQAGTFLGCGTLAYFLLRDRGE